MVDRRRQGHDVYLDYVFDRLLAAKLEQVYEILVPDRARRTGRPSGLRGKSDELFQPPGGK